MSENTDRQMARELHALLQDTPGERTISVRHGVAILNVSVQSSLMVRVALQGWNVERANANGSRLCVTRSEAPVRGDVLRARFTAGPTGETLAQRLAARGV